MEETPTLKHEEMQQRTHQAEVGVTPRSPLSSRFRPFQQTGSGSDKARFAYLLVSASFQHKPQQ